VDGCPAATDRTPNEGSAGGNRDDSSAVTKEVTEAEEEGEGEEDPLAAEALMVKDGGTYKDRWRGQSK
jgi:hypothetical protein